MCGIAGALSLSNRPIRPEDLELMTSAISHRGPDDEGYYIRGSIGLGMRRLSIIDLASGHQPVCNETGSVWVVFNGEIYNFKALRRVLVQKGHVFYTESDTEVIVHLYEQYGIRCVEHLRGMFAFALWDANRKKLYLARDRFGVKPLYYGEIAGQFAFASELKSLLRLPQTERSLDWPAVDHLFTFLTTPAKQSIIRNIHKLLPGHVLEVDSTGKQTLERYWTLRFEPDYSRTEEDFTEELRNLLEESVKLRLVSDVPVGAFLSGGIDSSTVVALMSRISGGPVRTFSVGYAEKDWSELAYAQIVAGEFKTDHHELIIGPQDVHFLEDLTWHLDEPFGDSSAIPTYMVSKLASEHVKVILSGDGGDEVFAGYDKYVTALADAGRQPLPAIFTKVLSCLGSILPEGARGKNFIQHFSLSGAERYLDSMLLFRLYQRRRLFTADALAGIDLESTERQQRTLLSKADCDWLSQLQLHDINGYLPLDILAKVDRMSMAHSIEAREPLLDHKLVELAAAIPPEWRIRHGRTKYMLTRAMKGIVPDVVLNRGKKGFGVPLGAWFRGALKPFIHDLLTSKSCRERGILRNDYVDRLLRLHDRRREMDLQLWTLVSFELWCRLFLDSTHHNSIDSERGAYEVQTA